MRKHLTRRAGANAVAPYAISGLGGPYAISGLGGMGKTDLAVEYAHAHRGEYDLVWWVSADYPWLINSGLAALAPRLDLPTAGRTDEVVAAAVLEALRRGEPYRRWLLVFEHADQPETLRDFMPRGPGHILIVSRNHRWQGRADTLELGVLPREESLEVLDRRVPGIPERSADRLAEELGDLPLAIQLAGAFQAESGILADEYLASLSDETRKLLADDPPSGHYVPLAAAFEITFAELRAHLPKALGLLRLCAFFGSEPIGVDLLGKGVSILDPELYPTNREMLFRAMRDVGRYGLARIDGRAGTIQVPKMITILVRDGFAEAEYAATRHDVHRLLAGADPGRPDDPQSRPAYRKLLPYFLPSDIIRCGDPAVRPFILNFFDFLSVSGYSLGERADEVIERWAAAAGPADPHVSALTAIKARDAG
jgi:hypothetical protein